VPAAVSTLPPVADQAERLIALGAHEVAGLSAGDLRGCAAHVRDADALLALSPDLAPASVLAPLVERQGKPGFVVTDMTDVDAFGPIAGVDLPSGPVYLVEDLDRGDAMANWSPDEALPAVTGAGRTPLTLTEGLSWVLQCPDVLLHDDRLAAAEGRRAARRPDAGVVDQQRDGPGRPRAPRRAQGRVVLGRQPAHVAGLRLGRSTCAGCLTAPSRGPP
jgi:Family of unknown function (DUF5701)